MMKKIFAFLILCLALAVVRILLMVLAIVLLLALVHAFVTRPRETLVFLVTLTLSSLAVAQPLAFIGGAVVIALALAGLRRWRRPVRRRRGRSLLPARSSGP
jgi:hypothetical protein